MLHGTQTVGLFEELQSPRPPVGVRAIMIYRPGSDRRSGRIVPYAGTFFSRMELMTRSVTGQRPMKTPHRSA